jgi:UPF0716 family protein affecting phage T7 exclusion
LAQILSSLLSMAIGMLFSLAVLLMVVLFLVSSFYGLVLSNRSGIRTRYSRQATLRRQHMLRHPPRYPWVGRGIYGPW